MTLKKYYDALERFDWDFSYRSSSEERNLHRSRYITLSQEAHKSEKHKQMWEQFVRYNTLLIRNPRLKPRRPQ